MREYKNGIHLLNGLEQSFLKNHLATAYCEYQKSIFRRNFSTNIFEYWVTLSITNVKILDKNVANLKKPFALHQSNNGKDNYANFEYLQNDKKSVRNRQSRETVKAIICLSHNRLEKGSHKSIEVIIRHIKIFLILDELAVTLVCFHNVQPVSKLDIVINLHRNIHC